MNQSAPQLVPATAADLPQIADLAHRIWNDHYPAIIGQEQVDYMLNRFYSLDALEQQTSEGQRFYLVLYNGERLGFVAVSFAQPGEMFIHKFYLLTTSQGRGLGSRVLQALEALFPQAVVLRLTVNRQNFRSINFYFKNGFTIEKVADFDIGQGYVMNDFVMLKKRSA